jgi:hypothetical protein
MSLSRWWKEGEWIECLGYSKRIEVNGIVLEASNFKRISQTLSGLVAQLLASLDAEPTIC